MIIMDNFEIFTLQKGKVGWFLIEEIHEHSGNIKMMDS